MSNHIPEYEKVYSSNKKNRAGRAAGPQSFGGEAGPFPRRTKRRASALYFRALELIAVALSYLQRSRVVRFLTAKLSFGAVVEVTDRFGAPAGHRLSSFLALIVADPRMVAVFLAGFFLLLELLVWIISLLRRRSIRGRVNQGTVL